MDSIKRRIKLETELIKVEEEINRLSQVIFNQKSNCTELEEALKLMLSENRKRYGILLQLDLLNNLIE